MEDYQDYRCTSAYQCQSSRKFEIEPQGPLRRWEKSDNLAMSIEEIRQFKQNIRGEKQDHFNLKKKNQSTQQFHSRNDQLIIPFGGKGEDALKIQIKDTQEIMPIIQLGFKPNHGYTKKNARYSLKLFMDEGILDVSDSKFKQNLNSRYMCEKEVHVKVQTHTKNKSARFYGEGVDQAEAEINCLLEILDELYQFEIIKEASIMTHPQRNLLKDPSLVLDAKSRHFLNECPNDEFIKKMEKIANNPDNFY